MTALQVLQGCLEEANDRSSNSSAPCVRVLTVTRSGARGGSQPGRVRRTRMHPERAALGGGRAGERRHVRRPRTVIIVRGLGVRRVPCERTLLLGPNLLSKRIL